LGLQKKPLASFFNCLLESIQVEPAFLYALLPCHKGAKQNTIKVIKETSAKLPHHKGPVPTYPMEKKCHLYTSCHRVIKMQLYNQGQQKPK
jgi:hypothetical protein